MNDITKRFLTALTYLIESNIVKNKKDLANKIGMVPSSLSEILSKRTNVGIKIIQNFAMSFDVIDTKWLLTGKGEMLKKDDPDINAIVSKNISDKRIPLVNISAVGGFSNSHFAIEEKDVKEYYVIPKFKHKKIDFMIEVEGSSMYPKYNSGDVVACTIISQKTFIQWNKTHVISTREQGIIIKRIKKGKTPDTLLMVSDNKNYDPFEVPKSEILGIALVIGVIRLE